MSTSSEAPVPPSAGASNSGTDMAYRQTGYRRKVIGFDPEIFQALAILSRDSGKNMQELANEAFALLLAKHHRPRTLNDALTQSTRGGPANENKPRKRHRL
jgi:hypothetical protein